MHLTWVCKHFDELSPPELYAIMRLRSEVFVVEQNCVFQDADNFDQRAWHLMGWHHEELAAYSRLIPAGAVYHEASIGRVITSAAVRGKGAGKELMEQSIDRLLHLDGAGPIRIDAQLYLKRFYGCFGFVQASDMHLVDGIEHIEMLREV